MRIIIICNNYLMGLCLWLENKNDEYRDLDGQYLAQDQRSWRPALPLK